MAGDRAQTEGGLAPLLLTGASRGLGSGLSARQPLAPKQVSLLSPCLEVMMQTFKVGRTRIYEERTVEFKLGREWLSRPSLKSLGLLPPISEQ